jgi:OTU domain-containing protein 5
MFHLSVVYLKIEMLSSSVVSLSFGLATLTDKGSENCFVLPDNTLTLNMQFLLTKGFGYIQVMEAYKIFSEDVNSMIYYLMEMGGTGVSGRERLLTDACTFL